MSATVDNRIVEMQFNNQQFERNAHQSISTLEKLKQALNFDKSSGKGLDDLEKKSKSINLNALANSIETISNRFSTMGIIGVTAMQRITNAAITTGKRMVEALTIDPVKTGFQEFETKIGAIQVIRANDVEASMTQITSALDELNHYADKTIYNFAQMTSNVGKFVAQGLGVEEAATAVKGMANLAAASGASPADMARATYQMSQALGGVIRKIDVNSLRNANMWTTTLKETLIDVAKAEGIAIDEMIEKKGTLEDTLEEGWLTGQMFTKAMNIYSGVYEDVQLKAMGFNDKQIAKFQQIAKTAEEAAVQVKTFTQLIDTIKESVQSGWTQSWETIIGDFEESKQLWTAISQLFEELLGKSAENRNSFLETWKAFGGRDQLLRAIAQAFRNLLDILNPVKEAFADTFEAIRPEQIAYLTKRLKEFLRETAPTQSTLKGIYMVFKAFFSVIKGGIDLFKAIGSAVIQLVTPLKSVATTLWDYIQFASWLITETISGAEQFGFFAKVTQTLVAAFTALVGIAFRVAGAIAYVVSEFFKLPEVQGIIASLLNGIADFGLMVAPYFEMAANKVGEFVLKARNLKREDIAPVLQAVGKAFGFITSVLKVGIGIVGGFFLLLVNGISKLVGFIGGLNKTKDTFVELGDSIGSTNASVTRSLGGGLFGGLSDKLVNFKNKAVTSLTAVMEKIKELDLGKVIVLGFGAAVVYTIVRIANAIGAIPKLLNTGNKVLGDLHKILKRYRGEDQIGDTLLKIAGSIAVLAGSLFLISKIDKGSLVSSLLAMTALMAMFGALIAVAAVLTVKKLSVRFATNATALLSIAASVGVLAVALKVLQGVQWSEIKDGLLAIQTLMFTMVAVSLIMARASGSFGKGAVATVVIAYAINRLVGSLVTISSIPVDTLKTSVNALLGIITALIGLTGIASKLAVGSGVGVLALAASVLLIQKALESLVASSLNLDVILQNIDKIIIIVGSLIGLMKITQLAGKYAASGGAAILAMSLAMHLLIGAVAELGILAKLVGGGALLVGAIALVPLVGIIKLMLMAIADTGQVSFKAIAALVPVTLCITLLAGVAALLGHADPHALANGIAFMTGIVALFGIMTLASRAAIGVDFKVILSMVAALVAITTGLALLSFADPKGLVVSAVALAGVLVAFGGGLRLASKALEKVNIVPMITMIAALGVAIAGLAILSNPALDWAQMLVAAVSLSGILFAIAGALKLMGGGASVASAAAMIIVSAGLTALAGALYVLAQLSLSELGVGLAGIAGGLVILAGAGALFGNPVFGWILTVGLLSLALGLAALGTAAIPFGVAATAIGAGFLLIANGLTQLSTISESACQNIYNVIVTFFSAIGTGVASMIVSFFATIGGAIAQGISTLITTIKGYASAFYEAGVTLINTIKDGIYAALPGPIQAIATGIGSIINTVRGSRAEMASAGSDMAAGIAEGVNGASDDVKKSGETVANSLEQGFREPLGWHSPMEKFFDCLKDMAAGILHSQGDAASQVYDGTYDVGASGSQGMYDGLASMMPDIKGIYAEFLNIRADMRNGLPDVNGKGAIDKAEKTATRGPVKTTYQLEDEAERQRDAKAWADYQERERKRKILEDAGYGKKKGKGSGKKSGGGGGGGGAAKTAEDTKKLWDVMRDGEKVINKHVELFGEYHEKLGYTTPMEAASSAVQKLAEDIYAASIKGVDAETQAAKTNEEKLAEMRDAFIQFNNDINSAISSQTDVWGKLTFKAAVSTKEWRNTFKGQQAMVKEWQRQIVRIGGRVSTDFLQTIAKMGPEMTLQLMEWNGLADNELAEVEKSFTDFDSNVQKTTEELLAYLAQSSADGSGLSTPWIDSFGVATEYFEDLSGTVQNTAANIIDSNKKMGDSSTGYAKITEQMASKAAKAYYEIKQSVIDTVTSQTDLFKKFRDEEAEEVDAQELIDNAESNLHGWKKWADSMQKLQERGANESLFKKFLEGGKDMVGELEAVVGMTDTQFQELNSYFTQFETFAQDLGKQMGSHAAEASIALSQGFANNIQTTAGMEQAKQMVRNFVSAMVGEIENPDSGVIPVGTSVDKGVASGIEQGTPDVENAATKAVTDGTAAADTASKAQPVIDVGFNLSSGIARGIANGEYLVVGSMKDAIDAAVAAAMEQSKSASPSKVFAQIGGYLSSGLAVGITENTNLVEESSANVTNRAVDAAHAIADHIASIINGEVNVDPTIRPVLDTSELEAGASSIDSMFSGRSYALTRGVEIQNGNDSVRDLIAQTMAEMRANNPQAAYAGPPINMYVYGAEGQSEEELANIVEAKIMHRINMRGGTWR